jgi:hypothetical protein
MEERGGKGGGRGRRGGGGEIEGKQKIDKHEYVRQ